MKRRLDVKKTIQTSDKCWAVFSVLKLNGLVLAGGAGRAFLVQDHCPGNARSFGAHGICLSNVQACIVIHDLAVIVEAPKIL